MSFYKLRPIAILMLTLMSPLCFAQASDAAIDDILRLSGLSAQVEQIPTMIKEGMKQARSQGAEIADSDFNIMLIRTDDTILAAEILAEIRRALKQTLSDRDIRQMLNWYRSSLGRKITRAEVQASTPQAYNQMLQQAQALLGDAGRLEQVRRIDSIVGATDLSMSIQEYSGIATFSAITLVLQPNSAAAEIAEFKQTMIAMRPQLRTPMEQLVTVSYLYMYQDLDDGQLSRYENFLLDPVTAGFNQVATNSLKIAIENSIDKWARALALIFTHKEQQS